MTRLTRPLGDTVVLELGHIVAGPYCSLLLADLGAEVIKIEHPSGGDVLRDGNARGQSGFNYVNRNKKSVTIDLKSPAGQDAFDKLVGHADVLIENYSPGTADRLDAGYDRLKEINPALIYCSIKGFTAGPYEHRPALDPVAEALAGLMSTTGYPEHPPARCGTSIADMAASFQGALAVVGAVRQVDQTGDGQKITAPMFGGTVGLMGGALVYSQLSGEPVPPLRGGGSIQSTWSPYNVFQTKDDEWLFVGPSSQRHWEALCRALGVSLHEDERFATLPARRDHRAELEAELTDIFKEYTRADLLDQVQDEDVPVAPVHDTTEVPRDPHLNATGLFGEITTAAGDRATVKVPQSPIKASGFDRPKVTDPPELGEHTDEVLASMGYSPERLAELHDENAI